jgi:hypothetical protein
MAKYVSKILTEKLYLYIGEVYAVALMATENAHKYLDYEVQKFQRTWTTEKKKDTVKAVWMLYTPLLNALHRCLAKTAQNGVKRIIADLTEDITDEAILNQAEKLYRNLWNAVKSRRRDQKEFDVTAESCDLNQRKPFFSRN